MTAGHPVTFNILKGNENPLKVDLEYGDGGWDDELGIVRSARTSRKSLSQSAPVTKIKLTLLINALRICF